MSNETTTPAQPRATTPDGFKVWCSFDELVELDSTDNARLQTELLGSDYQDGVSYTHLKLPTTE